MTPFTVSLDLSAALSAPERCPSCGSSMLRPVIHRGRVDLLCPVCHSCWHPELGVMALVDPGTSGSASHQDADIARLAKPRSVAR